MVKAPLLKSFLTDHVLITMLCLGKLVVACVCFTCYSAVLSGKKKLDTFVKQLNIYDSKEKILLLL